MPSPCCGVYASVALLALLWAGAPLHEGSRLHVVAQARQPDRILIDKSEKSLRLFAGKTELKKFTVALGSADGPKCVEGDRRTPEGRYTIVRKHTKSAYHKALRLSYPERKDVECARAKGGRPGGDIMIHGLPNGRGFLGPVHHLKNWTLGCIALTNDEIDHLFKVVRLGTVVEIVP